jgi:hypothetical protein
MQAHAQIQTRLGWDRRFPRNSSSRSSKFFSTPGRSPQAPRTVDPATATRICAWPWLFSPDVGRTQWKTAGKLSCRLNRVNCLCLRKSGCRTCRAWCLEGRLARDSGVDTLSRSLGLCMILGTFWRCNRPIFFIPNLRALRAKLYGGLNRSARGFSFPGTVTELRRLRRIVRKEHLGSTLSHDSEDQCRFRDEFLIG